MVHIEDVTDSPDGAGGGSVDGVRRRVHFSNEVMSRDADNNEVEGSGSGDAQAERSFDEQVNAARAEYQPTPMEKFMALVKSLILRAIMIYFLMTFWRSNTKPPVQSSSGAGGAQAPASLASTNIFINGTELDMYVYISEDSKGISNFSNAKLVWEQGGLAYGDWYGGPNADGVFVQSTEVPISKRVQNNGSIYLHTYIVPRGFSPDPTNKHLHSKSLTLHAAKMINKFKRKRYLKTHNLITGETTASIEDQEKAKLMSSEIVSHWHPNLTINLVADWTQWTMGAVPVPLNEFIHFIPNELKYKPILFYNDYWNLAKEYYPVNETTPVLPLTLTFQPLTLFRWQLYAAQSMKHQWSASFLTGHEEDDDEQDTLKEAFLDTNPYLLALTFVVSILHSIFEFLAFKNDIQFWNDRKSLEGLSVRSVFFNVFQSLIVLLYVLDNETNFVIKVSVFVGLLIEIWKIHKVMDVKLDLQNPVMGIFPRLVLTDKGSYVQSSTKEFDMLAFRYLSWVLFPLLLGYAVYSLLYVEQKGWYSWVLSMLYGFLLTFGFIMMTPQLFINYKLKSVAHLPWRMLSYKFLNTFIDDIFAFVIKMPTMYRIGCLRDDVIFFIYLYQRYIYRIDPTRVNEFGFSAEMLEEKKKAAASGNNKPENNGSLTEPTRPKNSEGASSVESKNNGGSPTKSSSPKRNKESKKSK